MASAEEEGIGHGKVKEQLDSQPVEQGGQEQHQEVQTPVQAEQRVIVTHVEEPESDETFQAPPRGLRNGQGARVYPRKLCNPTYKSRLSTMRFSKTVKKFSEIQLGHISKYKMDALLHMPYHLNIPMNLLEWLDQHIFGVTEPCFKHKNKVIKITKDMQQRSSSESRSCSVKKQIIYLDFVDFDVIENHQSTVDYSLPRISHIKNADFQYLALVDRNYESRKAFGVLPIRHISQTPYANAVPIGNIADTQQEVNFHSNAHETINENNPINLTTPDIKSSGTSFTPKHEIDCKVKPELHSKLETPDVLDTKQDPVAPKAENNVKVENKLLVSPEVFDPVSCKTEFDRVNSEESLWKKDLLFFPTIKSNHWVIVCMNSLFERTHFFDPCGTIQENSQQQIVHKLVSNYNLLCKLSNKLFKNVFNFKLQAVGHYPTNCLMHDSGHYLPLYMDNFEGKVMKSFSTENVPKQRMISAYRLFKSTPNKIKEEDLPTSQ
ncbi:hypothetical protein TRIUR3_16670 [Triticum urartu]|uniref:Ubiquitin-like protease family profile domain-containing protein n=1 Tax=Triticum urartu TaxID=4572 RepID=M8AXR3_TRIUA|nr:hypothetical protein TRIUR3_16670 [Triticum urartu]